MKILYVEDDNLYQQLVKQFLEDIGHTVDIVANMEQYGTYMSKNSPNLILMDIILPQKDGDNKIVADGGIQLAEGKLHKNIPMIFISIWSPFQHDERIKNLIGEDEDIYLTKPIDFNRLKNIVQKIAGG